MKLGENIYHLRKQKGLSQEKLAEEIHVARQTISNWELGETSPNPEQLKLISKTLNVSIDRLLDNEAFCYSNENSSHLYGYEYISKVEIGGIPLVHINFGRGMRKAKGIIAIGNVAKGVIAFGGIAMGIFSLGGISLGLIAFGGMALGILLSIAGLSIGSVALGGVAVGLFSIGGVSFGLYSMGGLSIAKYVASGDYAHGYIVIGNHVKGTVELMQSEVTVAEIRRAILEHFPNTWDIIVSIMLNLNLC